MNCGKGWIHPNKLICPVLHLKRILSFKNILFILFEINEAIYNSGLFNYEMTYLLTTWWIRKSYNLALSLSWFVNVKEKIQSKGLQNDYILLLYHTFEILKNNSLIWIFQTLTQIYTNLLSRFLLNLLDVSSKTANLLSHVNSRMYLLKNWSIR